jgi:hypothetical protein
VIVSAFAMGAPEKDFMRHLALSKNFPTATVKHALT